MSTYIHNMYILIHFNTFRGRIKEVNTETFELCLEGHVGLYLIAKEVRVEKKKNIARKKEEDAESLQDLEFSLKESVFAVITRFGSIS